MVTREEKVKALREYCHSTCDGPFEIDFSFMNDDALNEYYEAEFKEKQKGNKKMIRRKVGTNFLHTDTGSDFNIIQHLSKDGYDVDYEVIDCEGGKKKICATIYEKIEVEDER